MMTELLRAARWSRVSTMGCAYALGLIACSGRVGDDAVQESDSNLKREQAGKESRATVQGALRSGGDCERLLERFQSQLLDQMRQLAEQARQGNDYPYGYPGVVLDAAPQSATSANPLLAGASATPSGSGFSDTTVQVPGVDEADFVKVEGDHIYLLHGPSLYVLGAASANATEILGNVALEGEPAEMFVHEGKVVVFSRIYGPLPGLDQGTNPYVYYYYPTYTKLTVVDVTGDAPEVVRESYVEGSYTSSRRHDGVVRAILQQSSRAQLDYPSVRYVDFLGHPYSQREIDQQIELWVSLTTDTIADSVIEDYVPAELERVNGALVKQPLRCGDYWLPGPGLTQAGSSGIVTLDLDDVAEPLRHTTVLGYADRVYANDQAVVITQTDYRYYTGAQTTLQTNIHRFDIDGAETRYTASGTFSGYIQSQFSLDEIDGVIRVSATDGTSWAVPVPLVDTGVAGTGGGAAVPVQPPGPASHILTLGTRGQRLVELGRTPDFGENEQIYATRFIGDRGYVVTFRQIDPLFVVDLSDPAAPRIAGELQLPGYSNFLYPLPDHHLLAVGQDADANGFVQGMALQIFDVRDASAPRLAHKYVYTEQGYSEASSDHRAISFHPDQNLVAFPFQDYTTGASRLDVFRVSNSDGFTHLGSAQAPRRELSTEECLLVYGYPNDPAFLEEVKANPDSYSYIFESCRYYGQSVVRRGLFRDDDVYSIDSLDVSVHALDELGGPALSSVALPAAYPNYYPYYGGGVIAGAAGASGMAGAAGSAGSASVEPAPDGAGGAAMTGAGGASFE